MSLEPMQCSLSSSICIKCWCAFCLLRSSLDQASIVYPGVQHPNFGSISELQLLVRAIHSYGMRVVLDMDLSGFDGVYWKGLLCFRLNSAHCALGSGRDNSVNTELLQRVVATFEDVQIWVRAEAVREG